MTISYFVLVRNRERPDAAASPADVQAIAEILRATPGLIKAHLYTPVAVDGPFKNDAEPPQLALQLYFAEISHLEAVIGPAGHLQALAAPARFPSLKASSVSHQAMLTRTFPTPEPAADVPSGETCCSYLVHYPGRAQDLNAWLSYYLSHHPQLMRALPGIREIEILTRLDWCGHMPWTRVDYMQRNKVVFDSPSALSAALQSYALDAMREDYRKFPTFEGGNVHFAMATTTVAGRSQRHDAGR